MPSRIGRIVVLLLLVSCRVQSDTTQHQIGERAPPVQPSFWERLTNRQGQLRGRFLLPDGSGAAGFTYDCKPLFDVPEGRPAIGSISGLQGEFVCGGPPGSYQLEVYSPTGAGIMHEQRIEIGVGENATLNLTIQP